MYNILITRARGDETGLSETLQESGFRVIHEPLTEIVLRHTLRSELEHALGDDPNAIILSSRHGVRALAALCELRDLPLICVGEATAMTAESAGFSRVWEAGGDVEKLIEFIGAAYDSESQFIYVSAEHVRSDLVAELSVLGMETKRIVAYEATAATQFSDVLSEHLKRGQIDAVTFLSERSAQIFMKLLEQSELTEATQRLHAFAISETVALPLRELAWQGIHIASEPTLASLAACVDNVFL